jgi:hypothetical protein
MSSEGHRSLPWSEGCFVCGEHNPHGLGLRFFFDGDWVYSDLSLPGHFRGFLDRTHGGVVTALLDEAMGWATVMEANRFSYTGELRVRFRTPVPVEQPLRVRGRVTRHTRRLDFTEAELLDDGGALLALATGRFVLLSAEESAEVADTLIYRGDAWRLPETAGG